MYRIKLLIVVILIAASPVVAQNVMQSGKVDDMVSLINSNPGLAKTYVEKAIKADKEKSTEKIDGVIALIMALDRAIRCGNDMSASVYDERGILLL